MIMDANLVLSSDQAITVTAASDGVIDLAGVGVGNAAPNFIGTADIFGEDIGIGDGPSPPQLDVTVTEAFDAGGAATLQVQWQASIDDGTGNPSSWTTIEETPALALAVLTLGAKIGFAVPPLPPQLQTARFLRANYVVATGPMTAGKVTSAVVTGRDLNPKYPAAY